MSKWVSPLPSTVQCSRYKYNYDNHEIDILKNFFLSDNPVLGCTGGWATRYIGTWPKWSCDRSWTSLTKHFHFISQTKHVLGKKCHNFYYFIYYFFVFVKIVSSLGWLGGRKAVRIMRRIWVSRCWQVVTWSLFTWHVVRCTCYLIQPTQSLKVCVRRWVYISCI